MYRSMPDRPDDRPEPTLTDEQRDYVAGLVDLAQFLSEHPEFISLDTPVYGLKYLLDGTELASTAKGIGGLWTKEPDGSYMMLVRRFGPHYVQLYASRGDVCEKVLVGTTTELVPDPTVEVPLVEVQRDVYEWRCSESLLGLAAELTSEDLGVSADAPVRAEAF